MVEQSSKIKRSMGTGRSESLKLGFPVRHSRRESSVTYANSTGRRDIFLEREREVEERESCYRARNQSLGLR